MGINEIIMYVMVFFMALGALDKMIGNKFGLGEKFEEGIMAMGSLAMSMVGIIILAPILAKLLSPVIVPLYRLLGADPSMFATSLIAIDMGGFQLAQQMALNTQAGLFAGVILGSMMGPTIVFSIPVALGIIDKKDHRFLATGVLSGMITIPIGCFVGGLIMGMPLMAVIKNLIPIVLFAVLIALGLWFKPEGMIKGFSVFGQAIVIIGTFGLALGAIQSMVGVTVIPGIGNVREGIQTVGSIAMTLAGAFTLVFVITKVFRKPLLKLGKLLGMNETAAAGLVATLANNIPMFEMMKDMDDRGKIINVAFAVSAAFVFGDHLGFTAGVAKEMIFPMIVSKLVAGITAIAVAIFMANRVLGKNNKYQDTKDDTKEVTADEH
ncbi:MAG TPA: ethanolamine utilization protein EutH [Candidatus Levilactobacillus faecigallinarum]|uniref:Ethanolamine utilization protein EutH n=1 Tax=Candidatus Levilactobacillus faecigallinarum TaxID=2838638 RepID=A0A9D1QRT8_9LACO|nr:ethanolamine utilization protein EutH [Candidatus Levilactobacillus faecigallinarum]